MVETTGRKCEEERTQLNLKYSLFKRLTHQNRKSILDTHTQTFNGSSGRRWWLAGTARDGMVVGSSDSSSRTGDGETTVIFGRRFGDGAGRTGGGLAWIISQWG
jgi:hypothetical protein